MRDSNDIEQTIDEILTRGVSDVIQKDTLRKELLSGKKLRIKFGVDPTSPSIHLGRASVFLKLRDLQNLGHTIIFIIGDFTGVIGDTSDKESERPMLNLGEVKENMKTYFTQAGRLLNMRLVEKKYNSKWLKRLRYEDISNQADQFSVSDFIARENIKKRLDKGTRVSLREVLYPLMQGYDSVYVGADIEIGGTDQRFNLLAGRRLQEYFEQKQQNIIMMNLLNGTDGRKMSSSWGNTINVFDDADSMYGKIMSIRDGEMESYFLSLTRIPLDEVNTIFHSVKDESMKQRDIKMRLAREIVSIFHDEDMALRAENRFVKVFQSKELPDNIQEVQRMKGDTLEQVLMDEKIVSSHSEYRRLIQEGAIRNIETNNKITDNTFTVTESTIFKIGKKRFIKIVV